MDKRKVIEAYRRGLITLQECGQILGADKKQLDDLVSVESLRRSVNGNTYMVADHL
jgi:exonuclease VII small subunit